MLAYQSSSAPRRCAGIVLIAAMSLPHAALAGGVVRDGSIGPAGDVAGGVDSLGVEATYLIDASDGEQRGGSLFHSFSEFSIGEGQTATFDAPSGTTDVHHVVSRVTGGDRSDIQGTLRSTIQGAAVWLLNPAGIVFGENAEIDVPGSFHASTATELKDDETGAVFEAKPNGAVPMLGIASPVEFGFLGQGDIVVDGANLRVADGQELSLAADAVRVGRGSLLEASSGTLRIDGDRIVVDGGLSVAGAAGGEIAIHGKDVDVGSAAVLDADYENNTAGRASVAIEGDESVRIDGLVTASALDSDSYGEKSGEITIEGGEITIGSPGVVTASSDGVAHGGSVTLDGTNVRVDGEVLAESRFELGGDVTIRASGDATMGEHARVSAASTGLFAGKGGEVRLEASRRLTKEEGSLVSARGASEAEAGAVVVSAPSQKLEGTFEGELCQGACVTDPDPDPETPPSGSVAGSVVLDGSRGSAGALDGPHYEITESDGQRDGNNLFHSFSSFSVGTGQSATFTGSEDIHHVVARVTGGSQSEIDGLVCTEIAGASLWLLNSAGWVFHENARFDVEGGLHIGASSQVGFQDGASFWSQHLDDDGNVEPLPLTANVSITIHGLDMADGQSVELAAGKLTVSEGGLLDASSERSTGGSIQLLGGDVTINGSVSANSHYEDAGVVQIAGGVVSIGSEGAVTADAETLGIGGQIEIRGETVTIEGESVTVGGTVSASSRFDDAIRMEDYDPDEDDGDDVIAIALEAEQTLLIEFGATIRADSDSAGNAGEIALLAREIQIDGKVSASSRFDDGGTIRVGPERDRPVDALAVGPTGVVSADSSGGFEEGGEIDLFVGALDEQGNYVAAGDVDVDGTVSVAGRREAGRIAIRAADIRIPGNLLAESEEGEGGAVSLAAADSLVERDGSVSVKGKSEDGRITRCTGGECSAGPTTNSGKIVVERPNGVIEAVQPGFDQGPAQYLITLDQGERSGGVLEFDFLLFSLGEEETATFSSQMRETDPSDPSQSPPSAPPKINHVVATVTGDENGPARSELFGTVRSTIAGASLWLINEAGWLLGDETTFDVDGALHVLAARDVDFDAGESPEIDFGDGIGAIVVDDGVELHTEEDPEDPGALARRSLELAAAGDVRVGVDTELFTEGAPIRLYSERGDVIIGFETDQRPDEAGARVMSEGGSIQFTAKAGDVNIGPALRVEAEGGEIGVTAGRKISLAQTARLFSPAGKVTFDGFELDLSGTVDVSSPDLPERDEEQDAPCSICIDGHTGSLTGRFLAIGSDARRDGRIKVDRAEGGSLDIDDASFFGDLRVDGDRPHTTGMVVLSSGAEILSGIDAGGLPVDYLLYEGDGLGKLEGNNLLFDFESFFVGEGERASFTDFHSSDKINHIVARIHGEGESRVDGLLRTTIPGAALWLLDPDGWVFGSSARLDLRGSLHVGTSEGTASLFGTGLAPPAMPGSLGDGSITIGSGALLRLTDSQVLELNAGGDIEIGALATLAARGGEVRLSGESIHVAGEVSADGIERDALGPDGDGGQLALESSRRGTITIGSGGSVTAHGGARGSGGRISLRGGAVVVEGADADLAGGLVSAGGSGSNDSGDEFDGFGGEVRISAESIEIGSGGLVRARGRENPAGRIAMRAGEMSIAGTVTAKARPDGDGGRVSLSSDELRVLAGGLVEADGFEAGSGGTVSLRGGLIAIDRGRGELESGTISAAGDTAGRVRLAGEILDIDGFVEAAGYRDAGSLRLYGAQSIDIGERGVVSTSGGRQDVTVASVLVQSPGRIDVDGGLVSASGLPRFVVDGDIGDATGENSARLLINATSPGRVALEAEEIRLSSGGRVDSTSFGDADAGSIDVTADRLLIQGESGLIAGARGAGKGGDVQVNAGSVELRSGATISTSSGPLSEDEQRRFTEIVTRRFQADGLDVTLDDTASMVTGDAGSIRLAAENVSLVGSRISAGTASQSDGGNITLDVERLLTLQDGRIEANAPQGAGGRVNVEVQGMIVSNQDTDDVITAKGSTPELDGEVVVAAGDISEEELVEPVIGLPSNVLDASSQLQGRCAEGPAGSFVERLDRLPPAPDGPLMAWPEAAEQSLSDGSPPAPRVGAYLAIGRGCG